MKPFECPSAVPLPLALSVRAVMHNEARPSGWREIDKVPPAQALAWVEAVLRANGCGRVGEELAWWTAELTVLRG